ncbi:MAG TPA: methylated-DNA--[protein]-cysteine S-methyltransferase [Chroococcales cyanobacterium]
MEAGYVLFETAIGPCGIAWRSGKIARIQLPEANEEETKTRLLGDSDFPENAPLPGWVKEVIEKISAHLAGKTQDFSFVPLALDELPDFSRKVYEAALSIKSGKTATYGELAEMTGYPRAARAVGHALGKNPFPIVVPCHRVVAKGGKPGGFSAFGGLKTKKKLLDAEKKFLPSSPPSSYNRSS